CGGVQPDLLPDLADAAQREDGFLDRLLWSYPDPLPDRWTEDELPRAVIRDVERVFEHLYALTESTAEEEGNEEGEPRSTVVTLSPEAREIWTRWYADHVREGDGDTLPRRLRGPWAKMPSQLLRLTLILHVLNAPLSGDGESIDV